MNDNEIESMLNRLSQEAPPAGQVEYKVIVLEDTQSLQLDSEWYIAHTEVTQLYDGSTSEGIMVTVPACVLLVYRFIYDDNN